MKSLSISADETGITGFATTSIVQLHNLIREKPEARDVVSDVAVSLANIEGCMSALGQISIPDNATSTVIKEDFRKIGVAQTVNRCGDVCHEFTMNLERWIERSITTATSLRGQIPVVVGYRETFRTFRTQVQSCEAVMQFAVTSTQLMVQLRSDRISKADRENLQRQLQALEAKVLEQLDLTKRQQDRAQERKRNLRELMKDTQDGDDERTLAVKEVEEMLQVLEDDQVSCGVVFTQVRSRRSGRSISNIATSDNSRAIVELPDIVVQIINQRIRDVRNERGSVDAVGVYNGYRKLSDL